VAILVFNALENGMGGLDWSGLHIQAEFYGIEDVDMLIHRLHVIKGHKPASGNQE
jgi:hypothetical protein